MTWVRSATKPVPFLDSLFSIILRDPNPLEVVHNSSQIIAGKFSGAFKVRDQADDIRLDDVNLQIRIQPSDVEQEEPIKGFPQKAQNVATFMVVRKIGRSWESNCLEWHSWPRVMTVLNSVFEVESYGD